MARFLFLLIWLLPAELLAAQPEPINFFHSGLKLVVGMAIVIGIMLLFHVLNRKGFRFLENRHPGTIRIVETRPVGGRKSLCLVEVEGERFLLGLGNDRVECLHHFNTAKGGSRFASQLQASLGAEE